MMIERGLSPVEAGLTASLMQVVGLTGTFVAPFIAVRYQQQSTFNMSIGILYIVGFASLFIPILWLNILSIGLVGLGMGASISLAYTLIPLRTKGDNYTAALSGMAQSAGYVYLFRIFCGKGQNNLTKISHFIIPPLVQRSVGQRALICTFVFI